MTVRHCLACACLVLPGRLAVVEHPAVQARILEELDGLELLATPERPNPRPIAHSDLARLSYLDCVIKARQTPCSNPLPASSGSAGVWQPASRGAAWQPMMTC